MDKWSETFRVGLDGLAATIEEVNGGAGSAETYLHRHASGLVRIDG